MNAREEEEEEEVKLSGKKKPLFFSVRLTPLLLLLLLLGTFGQINRRLFLKKFLPLAKLSLVMVADEGVGEGSL
jgi:hypothetical protein